MFPRRIIRRGIRRGVRRLSRAAIISMVRAVKVVTLAEIAVRANISKDLVSEKIIKKEERKGEIVYIA